MALETPETLDPDDWEGFRRLAHQAMDDMIDYLRDVDARPVWQPIPPEVKEFLADPAPAQGRPVEDVYRAFREMILPHQMGNIHPRFWGWVIGTGTPVGVLAELLAATMNPNLGGGDHVANYVEHQVLAWFADLFGFPADASGLLVSGGSMANLVGLAVARSARAEHDIRRRGVAAAPQPLTLYASTEVHSCVPKAVELMGLGSDALRLIPVDDRFELPVDRLEQRVTEDVAAGFRPVCVIGTAGTVNTGATDDLDGLADLCERHGMWFHVDGAFGSLAVLAARPPAHLAGLARADSIAFDLHKWMSMPIEVGGVLVKDRNAHRAAFALVPDYLAHQQRGLASGQDWFSDYGIQLTRGFRALKVWMSIMHHGLDRYRRVIQRNLDQTRHLVSLVEGATELELLAPAPLNVVCFRYRGAEQDEGALEALNREILALLAERGVAIPSPTKVDGRFALRVAHVNHRTRDEDFDLLTETVIDLGRQLTGA